METTTRPEVFIINNGNWTEKGFQGYNKLGKRVFIHLRQMESIGAKKGDTVNLPIYALGEERTYQANKDANGVAIPYADGSLSMKRVTALSVFVTKAAFVEAMNEDKFIQLEVTSGFNTKVKDLGLTADQIKDLVAY